MHQYYLTIDGLFVTSFKLEFSKRELIATAHSNARCVMIDRSGALMERQLLRTAFPESNVQCHEQGPDGKTVTLS